jgi:DNA-directed RNA polymerase subunit RPC12/RpoP
MPIRFRCAYCNQLMGISTRKAGTVVRCPKCAGEIIVPVPEGTEGADEPPPPPPAPAAAAPPAPPPLAVAPAFEDKNFDVNAGATGTAPPLAETESVPAPGELPTPGLLPPPAPAKRLGLFVPLSLFIVSFAVVVLLLILMFVLGLIIGRHTIISDTKNARASIHAEHA